MPKTNIISRVGRNPLSLLSNLSLEQLTHGFKELGTERTNELISDYILAVKTDTFFEWQIEVRDEPEKYSKVYSPEDLKDFLLQLGASTI